MRDVRRLVLTRERLTELSTTDLVAVAGGQALSHVTCELTDRCLTGPSLDRCPTYPVAPCLSLNGCIVTS